MITFILFVLPILMLCPNVANTNKPRFYNHNFIDGTISCICTVYGNKGDLLSWYQKKESDSEPLLLQRMQHTTNSTFMYLTVSWTLEPSDTGSILYCAKQVIIPPEGKLSMGILSENIGPLTVHKSKTKKIPYVIATPAASPVMFDTNDNLTLDCGGSKTVDRRELTWYIQEPNTEPKLAESQMFNSTENVNHLNLHLGESYHCKKLFCAQDFHLRRIQTEDGTVIIDRYRELARSNIILLRMRGKEDCDMETGNYDKDCTVGQTNEQLKHCRARAGGNDTEHGNNVEEDRVAEALTGRFPLTAVVAVAVVAVLFATVATWLRCRRRVTHTQTNINTNENVYVVCYPVNEGLVAKSDLPVSETTTKYLQGTEATYAVPISSASQKPAGNTDNRPRIDDKGLAEVTYAELEFSALAGGRTRRLEYDSCAYATVIGPPAAALRKHADSQPKRNK